MSSNGGNRKSMDDVLASIRRIIGAEKKGGYDDLPAADQPGEEPLALGTPIREGNPEKARGPEPAPTEPAADPLSLTPNMRVDFSKLTEDGPAEPVRPEPAAAEPAPGPLGAAPMPEQIGAGPAEPAEAPVHEDEAVVIDEAALEEMIRRIVREEIDARMGAAADEAAAREDDMRRVVREELMGETGQNISRNVQKMIQAEVKRLSGEGG